ncbi:MAG: GNAT family N-acetyltransferase [Alphaproteobacteria bacterium]|nr:GNAT family N-acetyltransferase [Alphaproteobacteria bacterium]
MRPFAEADIEALARLHLDSETMRYFPYGASPNIDEARARAMKQIAAYAAHWAERGYGIWALEDRLDGGFVGRLGLRFVDELGEIEILYLVARTRWGQGLASEAGQRALAFGFETAGLDRIVALAMPANAASRRVMEKLGMTREPDRTVWGHDLVCYALTRDSYERDQASEP